MSGKHDDLGFESEQHDDLGFEPEAHADVAPDHGEEANPEPDAPGYVKSGLLGATQGATLGFGDEISGAAGVLHELGKQPFMPKGADLLRAYQNARDFSRNQNVQAHDAHSTTYNAGELLGGGAATVGAGASIPALAGVGALTGLGGSDAPLDSQDALLHTALGAGVGIAGGGLGKGIGKVAPWVASKLAPGAMRASAVAAAPAELARLAETKLALGEEKLAAQADIGKLKKSLLMGDIAKATDSKGTEDLAQQMALEQLAKREASNMAKLRNMHSQGMRSMEVLKQAAAEGDADAQALLNSPGAKDLFAKVVGNYKERLPNQLGKIEEFTAEAKKLAPGFERRQALNAAKTELETSMTADNAVKANLGQRKLDLLDVNERIRGIGQGVKAQRGLLQQGPFENPVLAHGYQLARGLAQTVGHVAGHPGVELATKAFDHMGPKMVAGSWNALKTAVQSSPHTLGKYAPILTQAAARGEDALISKYYLLQQTDPEARKMLGDGNETP